MIALMCFSLGFLLITVLDYHWLVCKLPCFGKVVEKIVWTIVTVMDERDYLDPFQLDFKRSVGLMPHWWPLLRTFGWIRIKILLDSSWSLIPIWVSGERVSFTLNGIVLPRQIWAATWGSFRTHSSSQSSKWKLWSCALHNCIFCTSCVLFFRSFS